VDFWFENIPSGNPGQNLILHMCKYGKNIGFFAIFVEENRITDINPLPLQKLIGSHFLIMPSFLLSGFTLRCQQIAKDKEHNFQIYKKWGYIHFDGSIQITYWPSKCLQEFLTWQYLKHWPHLTASYT
jgi:hypothetical protein